MEKEEREEDGIRGDGGQNRPVPGCGDVILLVEVGCDEMELRSDPPSAAKVAESCRATGSENEVGGGSAPECGDELLAEFDCDERFPPPLPQPVAWREEDGVRGATGSENEVGGGSAPECGDELLAEFDCDEQSDEPDLCLFIFRSGRTLPVSDMVPNFSSRSMSAA